MLTGETSQLCGCVTQRLTRGLIFMWLKETSFASDHWFGQTPDDLIPRAIPMPTLIEENRKGHHETDHTVIWMADWNVSEVDSLCYPRNWLTSWKLVRLANLMRLTATASSLKQWTRLIRTPLIAFVRGYRSCEYGKWRFGPTLLWQGRPGQPRPRMTAVSIVTDSVQYVCSEHRGLCARNSQHTVNLAVIARASLQMPNACRRRFKKDRATPTRD